MLTVKSLLTAVNAALIEAVDNLSTHIVPSDRQEEGHVMRKIDFEKSADEIADEQYALWCEDLASQHVRQPQRLWNRRAV